MIRINTQNAIPPALARQGWTLHHAVAATILTILGILATHESWGDIVNIALRNGDESYIFIVPFVVAYLAWVRRKRLRQCRPVGQWVGPPIVALGWILSWVGYNYAVASFWHAGAVFIPVGCLITVIGVEIPLRFAPAFVALLFLIPAPGFIRQAIAVPLQTATAHVTQNILEILGVSISRSGSVLSINGVEVGIAEACNGMRMVFALFLVSYAFAFATPLRNRVRAAIILASPLSALVSNIIRLIPTVWFFGNVDKSIAEDFHTFGGWFMLIVSFAILMGIIWILRWAMIPVTRYTLIYD